MNGTTRLGRRLLIMGGMMIGLNVAGAELQPSFTIPQLANQAEVIVVGSLDSIQETGPTTAQKGHSFGIGHLRVETILKGTITENPIPVRWTEGSAPLSTQVSGIWSLVWRPAIKTFDTYMSDDRPARPLVDLPLFQAQLEKHPATIPSWDLGFTWKPNPNRLIVAVVRPGSPAAEAKFEPGDMLIQVENRPVTSPKIFTDLVSQFIGGSQLKIDVRREASKKALFLKIPGLPLMPPEILPVDTVAKLVEERTPLFKGRITAVLLKQDPEVNEGRPYYDVKLGPAAGLYLDAKTGKEFSAYKSDSPNRHGSGDLGFIWKPDPARLVVSAVRPSSAAAEGGFKPGDTLLAVEGRPIVAPGAFETCVAEYVGSSRLKIHSRRNQKTLDLYVTLPPTPPARPEWLSAEQAIKLVEERYPKYQGSRPVVFFKQQPEKYGGVPFYDIVIGPEFGGRFGFHLDAKTGSELDAHLENRSR